MRKISESVGWEICIVLLALILVWVLGNTLEPLDLNHVQITTSKELNVTSGFPLMYMYTYWNEYVNGGYYQSEFIPISFSVDFIIMYLLLKIPVLLIQKRNGLFVKDLMKK